MQITAKPKLQPSFFRRRDTLRVARELLGKLLVVPDAERRVSGMIVEVEAYLGEADRAAHSYGGRRTARNEITYADGGHVYVFFVYGMYHQLNIVTGPREHPHVVLIRGVRPVEAIEIMRQRRGHVADRELTSGPGKLTIAFGIDRSFNGEQIDGDRIWIEQFRRIPPSMVLSGPRIGIDYAGEFVDKPWRFHVADDPYVSKGPKRR